MELDEDEKSRDEGGVGRLCLPLTELTMVMLTAVDGVVWMSGMGQGRRLPLKRYCAGAKPGGKRQ